MLPGAKEDRQVSVEGMNFKVRIYGKLQVGPVTDPVISVDCIGPLAARKTGSGPWISSNSNFV